MATHTATLQTWYDSLRRSEPGTIYIHDLKRPLTARLESRKHCGPYMWKPSVPGKGRSFYQHANALACGDSTIDLRLKLANDVLTRCRITRYFGDEYQDTTYTPIIALLPHGRGFLAGWSMGRGMLATLDGRIYETGLDAALAAHNIAEHDAAQEREYRANECQTCFCNPCECSEDDTAEDDETE